MWQVEEGGQCPEGFFRSSAGRVQGQEKGEGLVPWALSAALVFGWGGGASSPGPRDCERASRESAVSGRERAWAASSQVVREAGGGARSEPASPCCRGEDEGGGVTDAVGERLRARPRASAGWR